MRKNVCMYVKRSFLNRREMCSKEDKEVQTFTTYFSSKKRRNLETITIMINTGPGQSSYWIMDDNVGEVVQK